MNNTMYHVVYFHHDLRIDDHPSLHAARQSNVPLLAIYLWNDMDSLSSFGLTKQSPLRKAFITQTLIELQQGLHALGIPFYVYPTREAFAHDPLWQSIRVHTLFASFHPGSEEKMMLNHVQQTLKPQSLQQFWNHSLLHPGDYPFLLDALPNRYTDARLRVEQKIVVRPCLPPLSPQAQPTLPPSTPLTSPTLQPIYPGGEKHAQSHLRHYFFESKAISHYKFTRNNMLHRLDSSKLSPYLAVGALSPRRIYWELKRYETTVEKNQSTYWLWFELLWRDYFFFVHVQERDQLFWKPSMPSTRVSPSQKEAYTHAILNAQTGYPLVDANLLELYQTGWMSNRGRQNVASFIVHSLHLDWRFGAALFEHHLLDYDASSNYGNWQYLAGVGHDPRERRVFNISLQAKKYDPKGTYVHHWLPALRRVQAPDIYQPWSMNELQQALTECIIGKDYPSPIVDDPSIQLR